MALAPIVFLNIPPDRWERLKAAAASGLGAPLEGDLGDIISHGVQASYAYTNNSTLTITPEKKPLLMPAGLFASKLTEWVNSIQ